MGLDNTLEISIPGTAPWTVSFPDSLHRFAIPAQTFLASHPTRTYDFLATGAVVLHSHRSPRPKALLLQRAPTDSMPHKWEMPGGAVDDADRTVLHGAVRELWEEAGLRARRIVRDVGGEYVFLTSSGKKVGKFCFLVEVCEEDGGGAEDLPVRLDEKEHQNSVWATEDEVHRGVVQDRSLVLAFAHDQIPHTIVSALRAYPPPV